MNLCQYSDGNICLKKWEQELIQGMVNKYMSTFAECIPPKARRVIELGSETETIRKSFLEIQPDCSYLCSREVSDEELNQSIVDCFFYRSSYLQKPDLKESLAKHSKHLAENGQMQFVLENPGHFERVLKLLGGNSLPVAWRGAKELIGILEDLGFAVVESMPYSTGIENRWKQEPGADDLLRVIGEFMKSYGLSAPDDPWTTGYVIRAVKGPDPVPMMIQNLMGETQVTARSRVFLPERFCSTIPGVFSETKTDPADLNLLTEDRFPKRVLLMQRVAFGDRTLALNALQNITETGYLMVAEMDDNPNRWERQYKRTNFLEFRGVHAIQVSTPALKELLLPYNPEIRVFPNQLEKLPPIRTNFHRNAPVTIFFGALNREHEWDDIMPILNREAKRHQEKLRFFVICDKAFYQALETPYKQYGGDFIPYAEYEKYLQNSDIALLPLKDTSFNRAKSDLKFIESAANGVVVLASPTVYESVVQDGRNGFLYHNPREFGERLELLIRDSACRQEVAMAAYEYVKYNRLLSQHYEERIDWYNELIVRLPELNKALWKRLEEGNT